MDDPDEVLQQVCEDIAERAPDQLAAVLQNMQSQMARCGECLAEMRDHLARAQSALEQADQASEYVGHLMHKSCDLATQIKMARYLGQPTNE